MGVPPTASMVTIALPAAAEIGVMQERVATPSRCTVHAPQSAIPHPNFVPVRPNSSRSVHKRGVSAGRSTVTDLPLTFRVGIAIGSSSGREPVFTVGVSVEVYDYGLVARHV